MNFEEIRYRGKPVKPDKGFKSKVYSMPVAIEHNGDGSVTVCKEIAEEIYTASETPEWIKEYFKPVKPFLDVFKEEE